MKYNRLAYSFSTSVHPVGATLPLTRRDKWILCKKVMCAQVTTDIDSVALECGTSNKVPQAVLQARHKGVTVQVRFNIRVNALQKQQLEQLGIQFFR